MSIKRYQMYYVNDVGDEYDAFCRELEDGGWVTYQDHEAALKLAEGQKPPTNSQSVAALSEIVWDWLTENAVDVMVDECDVNILIQRLNAGVPALHT